MHHIYKQTLVSVILLACFTLNGKAQKKDVKNSNQQWFQYSSQIKFSDKWRLSAILGYRMRDGFSHSLLYFAGTRMGYQLNPGMTLSLGFNHLGFYTSGRLSQREYRPYQQFTLVRKYKNIGTGHRLRVEQRYFRKRAYEDIKAESRANLRFRYRFSLSLPLLQFPPFDSDKKLLFTPSYEIFINAGKEIVYNVFDRQRILAGLTMQFSRKLSVSMSYVHQFTALNLPRSFDSAHVLWLSVSQNFDW